MTLIVLDEVELEFLEALNYYEEAADLGTRFREEVSGGVAHSREPGVNQGSGHRARP